MNKNIGKIVLAGIVILCLILAIRHLIIERESDELTDNSLAENAAPSEAKEAYDVTREFYSNYDDTGLQTYVITRIFSDYETYIKQTREEDLCEYIYENEDQMIEVKLSEEQKKAWLEKANSNINDVLEHSNNLFTFDISEDTSELNIQISKKSSPEDFMAELMVLVFNCQIKQIFSGKEDWSVHMSIYNMDNGSVLTDIIVPEQELSITPEMWEN